MWLFLRTLASSAWWSGPPWGAFQEETFIRKAQDKDYSLRHREECGSTLRVQALVSSVELRRAVRNCGSLYP